MIILQFLITFIILSIINVIFSTVKSIATVKSGKIVASLLNGFYFSFYNVMIIFTVADFPLWQKCTITFICNVIGVFIVKSLEQRLEKDRLYKVEATVLTDYKQEVKQLLKTTDIPYNYIDDIGKYTLFNVFCATKEQSKQAKTIFQKYKAKYFIFEGKPLDN